MPKMLVAYNEQNASNSYKFHVRSTLIFGDKRKCKWELFSSRFTYKIYINENFKNSNEQSVTTKEKNILGTRLRKYEAVPYY